MVHSGSGMSFGRGFMSFIFNDKRYNSAEELHMLKREEKSEGKEKSHSL